MNKSIELAPRRRKNFPRFFFPSKTVSKSTLKNSTKKEKKDVRIEMYIRIIQDRC